MKNQRQVGSFSTLHVAAQDWSRERHMVAGVNMTWWYEGHAACRFGILRDHKGPKQANMCHYSHGDTWQRIMSSRLSVITLKDVSHINDRHFQRLRIDTMSWNCQTSILWAQNFMKLLEMINNIKMPKVEQGIDQTPTIHDIHSIK